MELRVLKYFLMTAREENITRAAEQLHMTQPTLSRQLAQLEEELGVKLFRRSNHNIVLTEDGFLLKRRAQEILSLAEKTKDEFRQQEEVSGEISIGCGECRSMKFLSEKMKTFRQKYPLVTFQIYSANADDVKERLDQGILDMGLLTEPVDIGKYDFVRMPVKERWGIYVDSESRLGQQTSVKKEDLLEVPVLMPGRESVQHELAAWFGDCYERLDIASRYNLILNAATMVQNGVGCAISLNFDVKFNDLTFVPLEPKLETGAVLVWKKNQMYGNAVRRFLEFVRE